MSLPIPESPMEKISGSQTKLELGNLANKIMPKTSLDALANEITPKASLDKLAEKTTKVVEGVTRMIENLPPEKLTVYVGAIGIIVASLAHDNQEKEDKKKEEIQQKDEEPEKPQENEFFVAAAPVKPKTANKAPVVSENDKYTGRKEINTKSRDRILKYMPDSDVIARLLKMKKDEPLVTVDGGEKIKESAAWAYNRAREIAKGMGYNIIMGSGYRPPKRQKELYDAAKPEDRGRLVAAPGDSWHQSGGAGDFSLVKLGSTESLTQISSKSDSLAKYTDILEYCMNRAGFVRYSQETWHFEIGSSDWAEVMCKRGAINKDAVLAYTFKKDKLQKPLSNDKMVG